MYSSMSPPPPQFHPSVSQHHPEGHCRFSYVTSQCEGKCVSLPLEHSQDCCYGNSVAATTEDPAHPCPSFILTCGLLHCPPPSGGQSDIFPLQPSDSDLCSRQRSGRRLMELWRLSHSLAPRAGLNHNNMPSQPANQEYSPRLPGGVLTHGCVLAALADAAMPAD